MLEERGETPDDFALVKIRGDFEERVKAVLTELEADEDAIAAEHAALRPQFLLKPTFADALAALQAREVDVVVSDMAPNLSGIDSADTARIEHLVELALDFAQNHLKPQGALVAKLFHGSGYSQLVKLFKDSFKVVKPIKPKASRDRSAETFLVGIGPKALLA